MELRTILGFMLLSIVTICKASNFYEQQDLFRKVAAKLNKDSNSRETVYYPGGPTRSYSDGGNGVQHSHYGGTTEKSYSSRRQNSFYSKQDKNDPGESEYLIQSVYDDPYRTTYNSMKKHAKTSYPKYESRVSYPAGGYLPTSTLQRSTGYSPSFTLQRSTGYSPSAKSYSSSSGGYGHDKKYSRGYGTGSTYDRLYTRYRDPCVRKPDGQASLKNEFHTFFPYTDNMCHFVKCANKKAFLNPCAPGTRNNEDGTGFCSILDLKGYCGRTVYDPPKPRYNRNSYKEYYHGSK